MIISMGTVMDLIIQIAIVQQQLVVNMILRIRGTASLIRLVRIMALMEHLADNITSMLITTTTTITIISGAITASLNRFCNNEQGLVISKRSIY